MNLDKSVEILTAETEAFKGIRAPDLTDALKLGIEALKHYQDSSHFACGCLLPGQTGETED